MAIPSVENYISGLSGKVQYKTDWYGTRIIEASHWFPSNKSSSDCGTLNPDLVSAFFIVVKHQVPGDTAEEGPGRPQAGDDVLQLLADGGPDEAVPGVTQDHDQGPQPGTAKTVSLSADRLPAETAKPPVSRGTGYVWTVRPSRAPTRLSARPTADRGPRPEGRGPSGRSTGA